MLFFCLAAGYLLRRWRVVPTDGYKTINIWVIYIGLPATAFKYLPTLVWSPEILIPILGPLLIFMGAIVFIKLLNYFVKFSKRTSHSLMLLAGLSNTSFVGFPLVINYFGESQLKWAIIADQMTFFLLSTLGLVIALKGGLGSKKKLTARYIAKRVFSFPPLLACLAALLIPRYIDITALNPFFTQLASTVSPLALFSVGMQLTFVFYKAELFAMLASIGYKLILGPILLLILFYSLGWKGDAVQVTAFEMAMPCLVSTSVLLQEFRLNSRLGNAIIGMSILVGLLSSFGIYILIGVLL